MPQQRLGMLDLDTGEVHENGVLAWVQPKRRNAFTEGWVAMAQSPLLELAKADLGDAARRVLFAVLGRLDFENWIAVPQAELAREIGMAPSNFNRALKRLLDEKVLLPGPRSGRTATYRLNPSYGWKGSAKLHREAVRDHLRLVARDGVSDDGALREQLERAGQKRLLE